MVNRLNVKILSSAEYKNCKEEVENLLKYKQEHFIGGEDNVLIYFDDDKDTYIVTVIDKYGHVEEKEMVSWDEISHMLYEMQ